MFSHSTGSPRSASSHFLRSTLAAVLATGAALFVTATTTKTSASAAGLPDLVVSVVASPSTVAPGAAFTWTFTATNVGDAAAGAFNVDPTGLTASTAQAVGWSCFTVRGGRGTRFQNFCQIGGLAAGASASFSISTMAANIAGTYSTSATIDPLGAVVESNETNNTSNGSYVVAANAPFDFVPVHSVSGNQDGFPIPKTATFFSSVGSIGGFTGAATVTVAETLPPGFTVVSSVVTGRDPLTLAIVPLSITCTTSGVVATGLTVTCPNVPAGGVSVGVAGDVTVVASLPVVTGLVDFVATDSVTVDSDNSFAESNETNNTASGSIRITNLYPDMAIAMESSPAPFLPGSIVTQTVTVTNNGSAVAPAASVNVNFGSAAWLGGGTGAVVCTRLVGSRGGTTTVARCAVGAVAPGATVSFPIQFLASGVVGITTINGAVTASVPEIGSALDNSAQSTFSVAVAGAIDLSIAAQITSPIPVDQPAVLNIVVTNSGIGQAGPTEVATVLPTGFSFVSGGASGGACTASAQVVVCPIATVVPHGIENIAITMMASSVAGPYQIPVTIDPRSVVVDSVRANNTTTVAVEVSGSFADLATSVNGPAVAASNGKPTYDITIRNAGAVAADNVTVTVNESGFSKIDSFVAPTGWTCSLIKNRAGGGWVNCVVTSLAAGVSAQLSVTVAGAPARGVSTTLTSTVDPSNTVRELNESNNNATFTTTIA